MQTIKKIFVVTMLVIATSLPSFGQDEQPQQQTEQPQVDRDPKARQKIEAARIGMITNKLGLTPEQAEKFWPIYREFSEKRTEIRKEFKLEQNKIKPENTDSEHQKKLVDLDLNLKQKELDLEKTYSGRLMKVITAEQMLNLRTAERDFHRLIIQQLQQRRNVQQRKENFRDKNQQLRHRKN